MTFIYRGLERTQETPVTHPPELGEFFCCLLAKNASVLIRARVRASALLTFNTSTATGDNT